jgi:hypothetical protein
VPASHRDLSSELQMCFQIRCQLDSMLITASSFDPACAALAPGYPASACLSLNRAFKSCLTFCADSIHAAHLASQMQQSAEEAEAGREAASKLAAAERAAARWQADAQRCAPGPSAPAFCCVLGSSREDVSEVAFPCNCSRYLAHVASNCSRPRRNVLCSS